MLRRNILIFHNAALGDFLMTWPLAMALGRMFAQSRVMYVTASQKGKLAERLIRIEYVDAELGWHALHGDATKLAETPAKLLRGAQMVVLFAQSDEPAFNENVRAIAGDVPLITIVPNPPAGVHVMEHQLSQLRQMPPIESGARQLQQLIRTSGLPTATTGVAKKLVIHPGSGAERKNWPIASFVDVAKGMKSNGWTVEFILGEAERERSTEKDTHGITAVAPVRQCASLDELADAILGAAAYLGNDSGPTHLAAMLGRKTVAMFGPTSDTEAWSPVGPKVSVLPFDTVPAVVIRSLL